MRSLIIISMLFMPYCYQEQVQPRTGPAPEPPAIVESSPSTENTIDPEELKFIN